MRGFTLGWEAPGSVSLPGSLPIALWGRDRDRTSRGRGTKGQDPAGTPGCSTVATGHLESTNSIVPTPLQPGPAGEGNVL